MDPIESHADPRLFWTDAGGRKWSASFTFNDAVRLRETQGLDLLDPKSIEPLFSSSSMEVLQRSIEALAELLRPKWERAGLSYTEFADSLLDSGIDKPRTALQFGLMLFFHQLGRGDLVAVARKSFALIQAGQALAARKADSPQVDRIMAAAIEKTEKEIDARLETAIEQVQKSSGNASGSSPPSPESIGGPSLSGR